MANTKSRKSKGLSGGMQLSGMQLMVYAVIFGLIGGLISWAAFAAPHNGGKPRPGSASGTIAGPVMVNDLNSDGLPNWGDAITFHVTSTADKPYVNLDCYKDGVYVLTGSAGFYPDYIWGQTFVLSNNTWSSGAADCHAKLYVSTSTKNSTTLATLDFHVNP